MPGRRGALKQRPPTVGLACPQGDRLVGRVIHRPVVQPPERVPAPASSLPEGCARASKDARQAGRRSRGAVPAQEGSILTGTTGAHGERTSWRRTSECSNREVNPGRAWRMAPMGRHHPEAAQAAAAGCALGADARAALRHGAGRCRGRSQDRIGRIQGRARPRRGLGVPRSDRVAQVRCRVRPGRY